MSGRSAKSAAKATDVKQILSRPARPLTEAERKERTSFYEDSNVHAVPVEPSEFARGRSTGARFRNG